MHNTAEHLERCIAALQAQDYPRDQFEILMVDNNSTDGSAGILARAGGVRALSERKQGSYAARNRALRDASGDVLAFTDSDCAPDPGWLRAIDRAFEDPGVQVVLGCRRPGRDIGLIRLLADYENKKDEHVFASHAAESYYGFTNNMGVRRDTFRKYGPFVERPRGADTIFVRRVVEGEGCEAVAYVPAMRIAHAEMDGVRAYYRKMFTYGRSRQQYRHIVKTRPLGTGRTHRGVPGDGPRRRLLADRGDRAGRPARRRHGRMESRQPLPAMVEGPGSMTPDVSVIVEWENTALAGVRRAQAALRRLAEEVSGSRRRVEVLICHDEDTPPDVPLPGGALPDGWRTVRVPDARYYELKNHGAAAAAGAIVVFLDSDAIPEPGWLEGILDPFADPAVKVVAGHAYIQPDSLYSKAFALWWFFPLRARPQPPTPVAHFFANNVAFRRATFLAHRFSPVEGTSRGACVELARVAAHGRDARSGRRPPRRWPTRHRAAGATSRCAPLLRAGTGWRGNADGGRRCWARWRGWLAQSPWDV